MTYQRKRYDYTVQFVDNDVMIPKYSLSINTFQLLIINLFYSTLNLLVSSAAKQCDEDREDANVLLPRVSRRLRAE